ncbi:TetR/AcrR family transcriptional regulator [Nonomuraea sp. NPDC005501]|uniref:TetR/AcrR family transcriptional regulator n=1 Tax=Nonomuraea sp. NPDC005501 TaxID=3156884 RepID=UPI0033BD8528
MNHDPAPLTLRERKKRQTRQRISDVASMLFFERGFDNVTVAEVAEAADVSAMTVFNHFPRKEDLFLDRLPEAAELITQAVRGRQEGESPLVPLRRMLLELMDQRHPLSGLHDDFPHFWRVVLAAPSLRARAREAVEEMEDTMASLLAEAAGVEPGDSRARLAAALTVAACRTIYVTTAARLLAGERADDIADEQRALAVRAFDGLERALPDGL